MSDAGGNLLPGSETRYLPFGDYRSGGPSEISDRGFTGQKENMELGLYYYNARYYAPGLGRFLSADTIVSDPANPQSFNRYAYVNNNPIRYSDPTGHILEESIGGAGFSGFTCGKTCIGWALAVPGGYAAIQTVNNLRDMVLRDGWMASGDTDSSEQGLENNALSELAGNVSGSPNDFRPPDGGQEDRVRNHLQSEGWDQPFGSTDGTVRQNLGIRGRVADFVGRNSENQWLIAESKGSHIDTAVKQLENTANGLLRQNSGATGNMQFRIYSNTQTYGYLTDGSGHVGGWHVNAEGYLGYLDELNQWHYQLINGNQVQVLLAP